MPTLDQSRRRSAISVREGDNLPSPIDNFHVDFVLNIEEEGTVKVLIDIYGRTKKAYAGKSDAAETILGIFSRALHAAIHPKLFKAKDRAVDAL